MSMDCILLGTVDGDVHTINTPSGEQIYKFFIISERGNGDTRTDRYEVLVFGGRCLSQVQTLCPNMKVKVKAHGQVKTLANGEKRFNVVAEAIETLSFKKKPAPYGAEENNYPWK